MKMLTTCAMLTGALAIQGSAWAALSPDEIARLGNDLLPWGAEKAGNADGSIPAYGETIPVPAGFKLTVGGERPDPFAGEKPLYSITAQNMAQYQDKLSAGVQEMLKKYPTYRLDIYPTHRTAKYPQYVIDNTLKNARTCALAENLLQLAGTCYGGVPFPIPKNGSEVMWNRTLKYDQYAYYSPGQTSTLVDSSGRVIETGAFAYWQTFPQYQPGRDTPIAANETLEYGRVDWTGPARKAGEKLVIHDNVDMLNVGRRAWSYLPGQRRVKLSPDVAYDTPSPAGGGVGTTDDTQVFYGSQDRYDYKLVGKKELFIPYNTFKLHDASACSTQAVFTPNHLNPDCVRWELHRVWVVEATLKPGKRHVYPKRTFYWDEDIPAVGLADNYDDAGNIYRVTQTNYYPFYETYGHNTHEFVVHDLASGAYVRQAYTPAGKGMMVVTPPEEAKPSSYYQANTLSAAGVR
ncbi:hypothetical protein D9M68_170320 [compost metagenome]|uniref:DUF1329 domain-containing protein n=1 Tax=Pseudomonas jinjuensis TaxID=198616 RepID=A0A1H0EJC2_9PSED|nr:DUF1329 domain-containing protein [Pseudomonas jinjuensis]SDN82587.1 Protein of unknown function [Pseudomonas jinjuensis]